MAEETNLSKLTPEEFAEFFMQGLKDELGVYGLQANKVGFLGYLVNILGNITYDSKVYKDFLFKEAFPATAQQDDKSMLSSFKNIKIDKNKRSTRRRGDDLLDVFMRLFPQRQFC